MIIWLAMLFLAQSISAAELSPPPNPNDPLENNLGEKGVESEEDYSRTMKAALNPKELQALKNGGTNIDAIGSKGHTALITYIEQGNVLAVKNLVEAGANVNITNSGATPRSCAINLLRGGKTKAAEEIMELLLNSRTYHNPYWDTYRNLYNAISHNNEKICALLAARSEFPFDGNMNTQYIPERAAIRLGHIGMLKVLKRIKPKLIDDMFQKDPLPFLLRGVDEKIINDLRAWLIEEQIEVTKKEILGELDGKDPGSFLRDWEDARDYCPELECSNFKTKCELHR